jgi:hypothetical protein
MINNCICQIKHKESVINLFVSFYKKYIYMIIIDIETEISIIMEQFFDIYLREKVNIEFYFDQTYVINGQKMKVMRCSNIKVTLESTKKKVKFLVILEIRIKVISEFKYLKNEKLNLILKKNIFIKKKELLMEFCKKEKQ